MFKESENVCKDKGLKQQLNSKMTVLISKLKIVNL